MPTKSKVAITVRLEPKLARRIKKLAKKADRSASSMIAWILDDRIDIEESHIDAILVGMEEARRGEGMDAKEFFEQLLKETKGGRESNRRTKRSA